MGTVDDAEMLKRRAQEARLRAATATRDDVRRAMLSVAQDYEVLLEAREKKQIDMRSED